MVWWAGMPPPLEGEAPEAAPPCSSCLPGDFLLYPRVLLLLPSASLGANIVGFQHVRITFFHFPISSILEGNPCPWSLSVLFGVLTQDLAVPFLWLCGARKSRVNTFVIPAGLCRLKSHTADLPFVDNTGSSSLFIKDIGLSCSLVPGFIWVSQLFNHLGAWLLPLRGNLFCCHFLISYCLIFHSLPGKVTRHQAPFISALVGSSLSLRSWNCKISHSVSLRCLCLVCVYLFVSHCRCTIFSSCVAFVFPDFSKSCKHLTSCSHAGNISIKFLQYSECELRPFKWRSIYL